VTSDLSSGYTKFAHFSCPLLAICYIIHQSYSLLSTDTEDTFYKQFVAVYQTMWKSVQKVQSFRVI